MNKTLAQLHDELAETLLAASLLMKEIFAIEEEAKQQINNYDIKDR